MPMQVPKCPWCAKPMNYVCTAATETGRAKHHYECRRCIVHFAELHLDGERAPDRARKLHREPMLTFH
jgi:hypothetical protein